MKTRYFNVNRKRHYHGFAPKFVRIPPRRFLVELYDKRSDEWYIWFARSTRYELFSKLERDEYKEMTDAEVMLEFL